MADDGNEMHFKDDHLPHLLDVPPAEDCVDPAVLEEAEFPFEYPELDAATVENSAPTKRKRTTKNSCTTRVSWTIKEEEEIRTLFSINFDKKERPKPNKVAQVIKISKRQGGLLQHRSKSTLKKKVYRMIDAIKQ